MKKSYILLLLLFVGITSCRKDRIFTNVDKKDKIAVERVNSSIFGMLVDASGEAQSSENILIGEYQTTTDEDGFFMFKDIFMRTKAATIKAIVPDYFTSFSVITPQHNHTSSVLLTMLAKNSTDKFSSQTDYSLLDKNGAKVVFTKDILTDTELIPFNGTASGSVRWVDPNTKNFIEFMPGQFIGKNSNGFEKVLKSYGMLVVELQDDQGQMLLLDQNETVELHFPIPQNMLNGAPTNIPLWYFDEFQGVWIEKYTAQLVNGMYIGKVNKLGYWTCNGVKELSSIQAQVKFENDFVVSNLKVRIVNSNDNEVLLTYMDAEGLITGKVPSGELLELEILSSCDNSVYYHTEIGPFDDGAQIVLNEMIISDEMIDNYTLTGILYDCNLDPIKNGYVKTVNQSFPSSSITDIDGKFELSGVSCAQKEVVFKIYNLDDKKKGEVRKLAFNDFMNIGAVKVCDQPEVPIIEITYLGDTYSCTEFLSTSGLIASTLHRYGYTNNNVHDFTLNISNYKGIGKYSMKDRSIDDVILLFDKPANNRMKLFYDVLDDVEIIVSSDDGLWVKGNIIGKAIRTERPGSTIIDTGIMSIHFSIPRYLE